MLISMNSNVHSLILKYKYNGVTRTSLQKHFLGHLFNPQPNDKQYSQEELSFAQWSPLATQFSHLPKLLLVCSLLGTHVYDPPITEMLPLQRQNFQMLSSRGSLKDKFH